MLQAWWIHFDKIKHSKPCRNAKNAKNANSSKLSPNLPPPKIQTKFWRICIFCIFCILPCRNAKNAKNAKNANSSKLSPNLPPQKIQTKFWRICIFCIFCIFWLILKGFGKIASSVFNEVERIWKTNPLICTWIPKALTRLYLMSKRFCKESHWFL